MIIHLSIGDFSSSATIVRDPSLKAVPFVIARGSTARAFKLDRRKESSACALLTPN